MIAVLQERCTKRTTHDGSRFPDSSTSKRSEAAHAEPVLAIAAVAVVGLLLSCLACAGVATLYGTSCGHPAVPPFVKRNAKVKLFTTNTNVYVAEQGIVREVSGPWVLIERPDSKEQPYWINFANVVRCRADE